MLDKIKGLGEKRLQILSEYGINTNEELMSFFPVRYFDLNFPTPVNEINEKTEYLIRAKITGAVSTRFIRKGFNFSRIKAECLMSGKEITLMFFNRPFIKKSLLQNESYVFFGKASFNKEWVLLNPLYEKLSEVDELKGIMPVYPTVKGIPKAVLKNAIQKNIIDYRPVSVIAQNYAKEYGLIDLRQSFLTLHKPENLENIQKARFTVAVEELTQLITAFSIIKTTKNNTRQIYYNADLKTIEEAISRLSFSLTSGQTAAVNDILKDLTSNNIMSRMLQGDVGSGKTVVAFLSMFFAAASGHQSVLMAPTEVLARQHYANFVKMFPELRTVFLSGSLAKKQADEARFNIENGVCDVIIGTHSVLSDSVEYSDLALMVVDEQHRFGVGQRNKLQEKGKSVDTLIMSATPIPRTLALIIYGDLDLSVLDVMPSGIKDIETKTVPQNKVGDMQKYILENALEGNQSYIVLPKVEEDEESDEDGMYVSVKTTYKKLASTVFKDIKVGLLYGGMPEKNKNTVMKDFQDGVTKVLVTTTVIEVGIDVKRANIIAIFGADKFGLSQLHQLRGRVGRAGQKSYCFLVSDSLNPDSAERLKILKENADGFKLAEYDLQTRGAGDFIGTRQHGGYNGISNINFDGRAIDAARKLSATLIDSGTGDKTVLSNPKLLKIIRDVTLN